MTHLEAALRALLSPFDFATVDAWRSKVNREVQELLGADMVTFQLPAAGGTELYSEQFDYETLQRYPGYMSDLDTRFSLIRKSVALGVYSRAALYHPHQRELLRSEYYNDYVIPNRAYDAVGMAIANRTNGSLGTVSGLVLHHERPRGRRFGRRGLTLFSLLMPAFRCGVHAYLELEAQRADFTAAVDGLSEGALLADAEGRTLHTNPALARMVALDLESEFFSERMRRVARTLVRFAATHGAPTGDPRVRPLVSDVRTTLARYRVRGIYLAHPGDHVAPVLVTLERLSAELPPPARLRERCGLTDRESVVALLLARGRPNAAVARALGISPHTARHHTECVLVKLGVHSRSEVEQALRRATGSPS